MYPISWYPFHQNKPMHRLGLTIYSCQEPLLSGPPRECRPSCQWSWEAGIIKRNKVMNSDMCCWEVLPYCHVGTAWRSWGKHPGWTNSQLPTVLKNLLNPPLPGTSHPHPNPMWLTVLLSSFSLECSLARCTIVSPHYRQSTLKCDTSALLYMFARPKTLNALKKLYSALCCCFFERADAEAQGVLSWPQNWCPALMVLSSQPHHRQSSLRLRVKCTYVKNLIMAGDPKHTHTHTKASI